jgi:hypothetical protein
MPPGGNDRLQPSYGFLNTKILQQPRVSSISSFPFVSSNFSKGVWFHVCLSLSLNRNTDLNKSVKFKFVENRAVMATKISF